MKSWRNFEGHCKSIIKPGRSVVSLGVYVDDTKRQGIWCTKIFAFTNNADNDPSPICRTTPGTVETAAHYPSRSSFQNTASNNALSTSNIEAQKSQDTTGKLMARVVLNANMVHCFYLIILKITESEFTF